MTSFYDAPLGLKKWPNIVVEGTNVDIFCIYKQVQD